MYILSGLLDMVIVSVNISAGCYPRALIPLGGSVGGSVGGSAVWLDGYIEGAMSEFVVDSKVVQ